MVLIHVRSEPDGLRSGFNMGRRVCELIKVVQKVVVKIYVHCSGENPSSFHKNSPKVKNHIELMILGITPWIKPGSQLWKLFSIISLRVMVTTCSNLSRLGMLRKVEVYYSCL